MSPINIRRPAFFCPSILLLMVSKKLMGVWLALDALLLTSGLVSLVLSQIWRVPDATMRMVLSRADLTGSWNRYHLPWRSNAFSASSAGTALGVALIITFLISIVAIAQKNHVIRGFVVLNYALLLDATGIIIVGTFVWWYTLEERANYHQLWLQASGATRIALQDKVLAPPLFLPLPLLTNVGFSVPMLWLL